MPAGAPGGDLLTIGSTELLHALMAHDLVDEFRLMIDPVLLRVVRPAAEQEPPRLGHVLDHPPHRSCIEVARVPPAVPEAAGWILVPVDRRLHDTIEARPLAGDDFAHRVSFV